MRGKLSPSNHCLIRTNCTLRQIIRGFQIIPLRHSGTQRQIQQFCCICRLMLNKWTCWTNTNRVPTSNQLLVKQVKLTCDMSLSNMRLDSARYQMVVIVIIFLYKSKVTGCGSIAILQQQCHYLWRNFSFISMSFCWILNLRSLFEFLF